VKREEFRKEQILMTVSRRIPLTIKSPCLHTTRDEQFDYGKESMLSKEKRNIKVKDISVE